MKYLASAKRPGLTSTKALISHDAPHRRPVKWLDTQTWKMPESEGLRSTVRQLNKYPANLVEIERRLSSVSPQPVKQLVTEVVNELRELEHIPGRIQAVLERKGQAIVYGPPGTGKTYWASSAARQLAAHAAFGMKFEELDSSKQSEVMGSEAGEGLVRTCTFHPAYGYEDFIEGYRPSTNEGRATVLRPTRGHFQASLQGCAKTTRQAFLSGHR